MYIECAEGFCQIEKGLIVAQSLSLFSTPLLLDFFPSFSFFFFWGGGSAVWVFQGNEGCG